MEIMIGIVGFLIFTALWFNLSDIKTEMKYRNTLQNEQNKILTKISDRLWELRKQ